MSKLPVSARIARFFEKPVETFYASATKVDKDSKMAKYLKDRPGLRAAAKAGVSATVIIGAAAAAPGAITVGTVAGTWAGFWATKRAVQAVYNNRPGRNDKGEFISTEAERLDLAYKALEGGEIMAFAVLCKHYGLEDKPGASKSGKKGDDNAKLRKILSHRPEYADDIDAHIKRISEKMIVNTVGELGNGVVKKTGVINALKSKVTGAEYARPLASGGGKRKLSDPRVRVGLYATAATAVTLIAGPLLAAPAAAIFGGVALREYVKQKLDATGPGLLESKLIELGTSKLKPGEKDALKELEKMLREEIAPQGKAAGKDDAPAGPKM